jgi:hypothetical protein
MVSPEYVRELKFRIAYVFRKLVYIISRKYVDISRSLVGILDISVYILD